MNRYSFSLLVLSLLAGCVASPPPPLTVNNPANPSAPEANLRPLHNSLGIDDLTRKSRQILAQTAKEQKQWDQNGLDSGDQQGQPMKNMPGMQMPSSQTAP